ncbi:hypothetical protein K435DRAFT_811401 [Dendrothele bispora CBS 962.96]|uniref:Uncharacterized protein n=1 Tax=Dendrothele bispora (strain CBS 962.96) TaxID=1314807 RepID=A0A4S8KS42_DENBC|nr:hypothetical protein K435DRAFT_811401 [Dendrothele bispora CBS 962.96]
MASRTPILKKILLVDDGLTQLSSVSKRSQHYRQLVWRLLKLADSSFQTFTHQAQMSYSSNKLLVQFTMKTLPELSLCIEVSSKSFTRYLKIPRPGNGWREQAQLVFDQRQHNLRVELFQYVSGDFWPWAGLNDRWMKKTKQNVTPSLRRRRRNRHQDVTAAYYNSGTVIVIFLPLGSSLEQ